MRYDGSGIFFVGKKRAGGKHYKKPPAHKQPLFYGVAMRPSSRLAS